MLLCPCSRTALAAAARVDPSPNCANLISMGRFTPVTTSTLPSSRNVEAIFVGVPPNISVRIRTPSGLLTRSNVFSIIPVAVPTRSEEHTSELQSLAYLVCRLLLEKKKKTQRETCKIQLHEYDVS